MSTFEDENYRWRETYFVLFDETKRPRLDRVKKALSSVGERFELVNPQADEQGLFESITVLAPDDFAALDICYVGGEEVQEQSEQLVAEMKLTVLEPNDQERLKRIAHCTGRFDVLHFEKLPDADEEDEELLDPSAALLVLDALAKVTHGTAVDPQSGTIM